MGGGGTPQHTKRKKDLKKANGQIFFKKKTNFNNLASMGGVPLPTKKKFNEKKGVNIFPKKKDLMKPRERKYFSKKKKNFNNLTSMGGVPPSHKKNLMKKGGKCNKREIIFSKKKL